MLQMVMDDTIAEALESDNLTLQTMSGGKYVQVKHICQLRSHAIGRWNRLRPHVLRLQHRYL